MKAPDKIHSQVWFEATFVAPGGVYNPNLVGKTLTLTKA